MFPPKQNRMEPVEDDETVSAAMLPIGRSQEGTTNWAAGNRYQTEISEHTNDFHTLRSDTNELMSQSELQISYSATLPFQNSSPPGFPDILWSQNVLAEFSNLADFTHSEAASLCTLLGNPADDGLMKVKQFLRVFQSQPAAYLKLRELTRLLKHLKRQDVLMKIREQTNLRRWLGPVLPEEIRIKDMTVSHRIQFTTALSITDSAGNDWRLLAHMLHIPRTHVELWQERSKNPAEMVLKSWEVKVTEATVGRLFDLMTEMRREDLAALL
ncbi:uncharacterized protein LOC134573401 [Pelobates fuscus]|uniref:uncharacterized protein LOC134573401 n=1 Tax=Pelobates fuscus TaxID=191477 RepID=UPI002FE48849